MTHNPSIAILLAAYNGQEYLAKQLYSIVTQTYTHWTLYVIDDGSTDQTADILKHYQAQYGSQKIHIKTHPNQGCARTFLTLVCDPDIQADYYAYSDQDDIWDSDKLAKAIACLSACPNYLPQLYCSSARLIDADENHLGFLPLKKRPPSFQNALVQCITTGNTMVFNQAVRRLLLTAGVVPVPLHDWWTYLVTMGCNGECHYDPRPTLSYRQHTKNVLGFPHHFFARYLKRLKRVLNNQLNHINHAHLHALHSLTDQLTPAALTTLHYYQRACTGNRLQRLYYLHKSGIYRQERLETWAIYMALLR